MRTIHHRRILSVLVASALLAVVLCGTTRAQERYASIGSANFDVKYQRGVPEEDVRAAVEFLQKEYTTLQEKLGLAPKNRIEVRIYESVGKYLAETNLTRPWRGAIAIRGILHMQPVKALTQRRIMETALSYELAGIFLVEAGEKGCPMWLREAFAVFHSREWVNLTPPIGARLTAFSDLNQDIQEYQNPPQRDDVHYILAYTMMFMVHRYGDKEATRVFRMFDGATSVDKVFKKNFNEEYPAIEKAWSQYIAFHTSSFKKKQ